jgi:hypothetical protein
MALFSKSPEKTIQRDIDAAKTNRDRLSAKLAESETAIIERRSAAQALARDGADDAMLEKAEAAIRSAQDRAATIAGAIADVVQQLAALEQIKAETADRKLRSETAAEVATMATGLENAAKKFDVAVAELAEIAGRAAKFCPDAVGLEAFASSSRVQVPPATELVVTVMLNYAAAVLRGEGRATLPKPEAAVMPAAAPPKPVTVRLFAMKPVRWKDEAGLQRFVGKFNDVDLPGTAAAFALKKGICVELADPKRKQLHGLAPGHPEPNWCVDLDDETETALAEEKSRHEEQHVVLHSSVDPTFQILDRGKPFIVRTPAGNPNGEAA